MAIEKILIRIMAGLALLFSVLSAIYYPLGHSIFPLVCFIVFVTADILLPSNQSLDKANNKRSLFEKIIIGLIFLSTIACFIAVMFLWKLGSFGRLR